MKAKIIHMGHAGHFVMGSHCGYRLNTYVNGFIVSTVGELRYPSDPENGPHRPLGADPNSLYETFVFTAKKSDHKCCPYVVADHSELEGVRYDNVDDAAEGHEKMVKKYARKTK